MSGSGCQICPGPHYCRRFAPRAIKEQIAREWATAQPHDWVVTSLSQSVERILNVTLKLTHYPLALAPAAVVLTFAATAACHDLEDPAARPSIELEVSDAKRGGTAHFYSSPAITVNPKEEAYQLAWETKGYGLVVGGIYRLRVLVGARLLG